MLEAHIAPHLKRKACALTTWSPFQPSLAGPCCRRPCCFPPHQIRARPCCSSAPLLLLQDMCEEALAERDEAQRKVSRLQASLEALVPSAETQPTGDVALQEELQRCIACLTDTGVHGFWATNPTARAAPVLMHLPPWCKAPHWHEELLVLLACHCRRPPSPAQHGALLAPPVEPRPRPEQLPAPWGNGAFRHPPTPAYRLH